MNIDQLGMTRDQLLQRYTELINFRNNTYDLTIEHRDLLLIQIYAIADVLDGSPVHSSSPCWYF